MDIIPTVNKYLQVAKSGKTKKNCYNAHHLLYFKILSITLLPHNNEMNYVYEIHLETLLNKMSKHMITLHIV